MTETSVTIVSTNLSKELLGNYKEYVVIDNDFSYNEIKKYKKVLFFNILNNLSSSELEKLFGYLKDSNIKFINITNNMELCLYTSYLIIYNEKDILIEGTTMEVLKEDKLLKRIGLKLPFMVELSLLLKDYGLIKDIYLDKESLVNILWKDKI